MSAPVKPIIEVQRNVNYQIARNCWGCLHVYTLAIVFCPGFRGYGGQGRLGWRLEVMTPFVFFRFHPGKEG